MTKPPAYDGGFNKNAMKIKRSRRFDGDKLAWIRFFKEFAVIAIVVFLVFRFVIGISRVSGNSMYPTYRDGEPVVYSRLHPNYKRGDVASVRMPSGEYIIKRVVAVGGDTVEVKDGVFIINGEPEEGSYINGETEPQDELVVYPITLKEGQIFVLGDNRAVSIDSRTIGPVATSQTRGKILLPVR